MSFPIRPVLLTFLIILTLTLGACSSFTARRFAAFTVETVPAGGTVRMLGRKFPGDGCSLLSHSHRVTFERTPENSRFSAHRAPLAGGVFGGTTGLFLTLFSPPLGLAVLVAGGSVASIPAFVDHQVSRARWKKEEVGIPVVLTLEHPDFPTRTVRFTVVGHPSRRAARNHVQALRYTFSDDRTFTLFKTLKSHHVRKLVLVPVVEPFEDFERGLIEFGGGTFSLQEHDADVDARVYVLPPGTGRPEITPAGRRWRSGGGLLAGVPEEDPVRRIRVVAVHTGQVLFDSHLSFREYASAMKTQYFQRKSIPMD